MTTQIDEATIFGGPVTFLQLPKVFKGTLKPGSATPSVKHLEVMIAANTAPLTITNFPDGQDGQTIRIFGEGQTTVANNANIVTNTGANKLLAANKFYRFTLHNKVWYEDA